MIDYEVANILLLGVAGAMFLRPFGINGWPLLPLSLLTGITVFTLIFYVQSIFLALNLNLTLLFTLLLALAFFIFNKRRGVDLRINPRILLLGVLVPIAACLVTSNVNLARLHTDSLNFLIVGRGIYLNDPVAISTYNIENRLSTVPVIHSLGGYSGNYYLPSITPLVSMAILAILAWLLRESLQERISKRNLYVFMASGILLLISCHNYVFHSFYLNGHLLMAAYSLLGVGAGYMLARRIPGVSENALVVLQVISILGLVFTRVEGTTLAGIIILPTLLNKKVAIKNRMLLLAVLGIATLIQQLSRIRFLNEANAPIPNEILFLVVVGAALIIAIPLLRWNLLFKNLRIFLWSTEIGLWLVLAAMYLRNPKILNDSVYATFNNTVVKLDPWGAYLIMLALLFIIVLVVRKFDHQIFLRFSVTTFLPIAFLLAYLRGGAYRIHNADSLNRMLIQIVPVVVLFIIIAIAIGKPRLNILNKTQQSTRRRKSPVKA